VAVERRQGVAEVKVPRRSASNGASGRLASIGPALGGQQLAPGWRAVVSCAVAPTFDRSNGLRRSVLRRLDDPLRILPPAARVDRCRSWRSPTRRDSTARRFDVRRAAPAIPQGPIDSLDHGRRPCVLVTTPWISGSNGRRLCRRRIGPPIASARARASRVDRIRQKREKKKNKDNKKKSHGAALVGSAALGGCADGGKGVARGAGNGHGGLSAPARAGDRLGLANDIGNSTPGRRPTRPPGYLLARQ